MGQKVNPHGLRVGVIKNWDSRWYVEKKAFGDTLVEDYKIFKVKSIIAGGKTGQESIINALKEAEKIFEAYDKIPTAIWEAQYREYQKELDAYKNIRVIYIRILESN